MITTSPWYDCKTIPSIGEEGAVSIWNDPNAFDPSKLRGGYESI
jgi:hypothetical protein